jgi:RHS repeat-associated protein
MLVSHELSRMRPRGKRNYDELASGRSYVQSDPIGIKSGVDTYTYVRSNPISLLDADGLEPRGGGPAPTSECAYYDAVCRRTGCGYYCGVAPIICRNPYSSPFLWGVAQTKVNCIRTCLVQSDQDAWKDKANLTDTCPQCLKDSVIDAYHENCYTKCDVSTSRFPGVRPLGIPLGNQ